MEELTQTIIEIPKFTLFIPTRERPIHRIVLGTHRCRIVDIGDFAFPIEDGTLSLLQMVLTFFGLRDAILNMIFFLRSKYQKKKLINTIRTILKSIMLVSIGFQIRKWHMGMDGAS